ncbi:hypothetical protein PP997_gp63 [Gordonia phage BigChungus]|uniref:Uncharacterized protein n=2 Tax=Ponsvirus TaxID=3044795 RepID=A0AAE7XCL1_9CAUD|nr:hypothetical protein PP997_gp63 [Gordonia phage BigChungus]YP_010663483.1 hypothetical protein PP998_gp66 [Gordonia phage Vine]QNJ59423.1 hypothetical protein SEA_FEASTONYEET_63 [Gordonia phage Feastonyeet]UXE03303.1 hypothetical protein SEA_SUMMITACADEMY_63 [Gordonia phage SummitAcademy]WNN94198.1 hypothetical protein SEA_ELINAL_68 [Gordonia phage Elinal]QNJ59563.1 hypothetical protein SEA_BIGCHUNGUS_63 [Gordonia phage BigChungus]QZD97775.1 hypothetical protein SEA_VINE_66 [Gordonia phage
MSESAQVLRQIIVELCEQRVPIMSGAFSEMLDERLAQLGWNLTEHDAPLSKFDQGAIEISNMYTKLMDQGFNESQAFELTRLFVQANIDGKVGQ